MAKPMMTRNQFKRRECVQVIEDFLYSMGFEKTEKVIKQGMVERYEDYPPDEFVSFSRGAFKKIYKVFKELYV